MNTSLEIARRQMIDQQVRAWEVLDDRVLETLAAVPRERFVPDTFREVAFADTAIPLGHGQHMLTPKLEGRILQALAITRGEEVLEVGTGSGFFAACLARLGSRVHSLELYDDLAHAAEHALKANSVTNVTVESLDATRLDAVDAYDAIAVTASLPVYDSRFERALRPGGRLFVVVGEGPVMQAQLVTRGDDGEYLRRALFETSIDPLVNAARPPRFRF